MYLSVALVLVAVIHLMAVSAQVEGGYALRVNGTCSSEMTDCGQVARGTFHSCCPSGQVCRVWKGYIQACCPTEEDCRQPIEEVKVCANDDWNMYIQGKDNGFCCPNGLVGYETRLGLGRAICVAPGTEIGMNEAELNEKEQGDRDSYTPTGTETRTATRTRSITTSTLELEPTETTSESEPEETETAEETTSTTPGIISRTTPPGSSPTRSSASSTPTDSGDQRLQASGVLGPLLLSLMFILAF